MFAETYLAATLAVATARAAEAVWSRWRARRAAPAEACDPYMYGRQYTTL